jgi:DNA helicase IV
MSINVKTNKFSRSQTVIKNAPVDTNYVVDGGPGSGKTLLALNRSEKINQLGQKTYNRRPDLLFIVYNKALRDFIIGQAKQIGLYEKNVKTYHAWLWGIYQAKLNTNYPQYGAFKPKWDEVKTDLLQWHNQDNFGYDHVILDEAQDLPFELIEIFNSISKNVTVFMDPQQKIDSDESFRPDRVANLICKDPRNHVFYLNENHRNSQAITDLAMKFCPDGSLPPISVNRDGKKPVLHMTNGNNYASHIVKYFSEHPDEIIGVILPTKAKKDDYFGVFSNLTDKAEVFISSSELRSRGKTLKFDMHHPGIKVLTVTLCKGLEFDSVFIPEIDNAHWFNEDQKKINQAMVAITRAKGSLFLQASGSHIETVKSRSFFQHMLSESSPELVEIRTLDITEEKLEAVSPGPDDFDDDIPF